MTLSIRKVAAALACMALPQMSLAAQDTASQAPPAGVWRGTSTCTDREAAPACHDEVVVYEFTTGATSGTIHWKADKIVEGKRAPMGEMDLVYDAADACWKAEFKSAQVHSVWCLVIDGEHMTGTGRLLPGKQTVRKIDVRKDAEASGPGARWPVPTDWKHETFALPPDFAPDFPYQGTEDLRFMPGFSSPAAPDYWSYDLVWWLDQPPSFDATSLAAALTTYFRGLSTAVGGEKYKLDPARYRAVLTAVPASKPPRVTGQVFTYDPFATGLPITLNVEAELRSCPRMKQSAVVVILSPAKTTDGVWKALRATSSTLVCD